jgi:hypothetical protein
MQVYLPDDLYDLVKKRRLPASELLQDAVRAEVRRRQLLEEGGFWHFAKRVCGHPASRQSSWWNAWKVTPVETPVRTGFSRLATSLTLYPRRWPDGPPCSGDALGATPLSTRWSWRMPNRLALS